MEYRQLKNFGQLYTPKASARIWMTTFGTLPKELGFVGTPRFLASLQSKLRYWKRKRFKAVEGRGIKHKDFIDGIRESLAFYTALVATCGVEKSRRVYPGLAQKVSVMMWEEFIPAAGDFLRFDNPWEALRQYMLEFYRTNAREGIWKYRVLRETETDFHVHVTDCAWAAMHDEGGCLDAFAHGSYSEVLFFPGLAQAIGGDFKQYDGCLCRRDPICDWHFCRNAALR
jgi:hypothetical protein